MLHSDMTINIFHPEVNGIEKITWKFLYLEIKGCCCCCSVKQELCKVRDREIRFLCPRPCLCCSHSCSPLSTLSPQAYKHKTDRPHLKVAPSTKQAALLKQRKKTVPCNSRTTNLADVLSPQVSVDRFQSFCTISALQIGY